MPCGFATDCPLSYSAAELNASVAAWDPTNNTQRKIFELAREKARAKCVGVALGKGQEIRQSTGWCLRVRNGVNISACARWKQHAHSVHCRSYFLPKGPPQYYPADRPFVAALAALLSGRILQNASQHRGGSGGHHRPGAISSASSATTTTTTTLSSFSSSSSSSSPMGALHYDSLADFGAGVGAYGHALLSYDPRIPYRGYDGAGNVELATSGFVQWFDLSLPLSLPRADWVLSLEVGEHLHQSLERQYVRNLIAHARKGVILSWANLKQPGYGHINNHSPSYLASLFSELGFRHDPNVSAALRAAASVKGNAQYWLAATVSAYVRRRYLPEEADEHLHVIDQGRTGSRVVRTTPSFDSRLAW